MRFGFLKRYKCLVCFCVFIPFLNRVNKTRVFCIRGTRDRGKVAGKYCSRLIKTIPIRVSDTKMQAHSTTSNREKYRTFCVCPFIFNPDILTGQKYTMCIHTHTHCVCKVKRELLGGALRAKRHQVGAELKLR